MKLVVAAGEFGSDRLAVSGSYRAKLRRHEILWAWLSLLTLVICWDAAARLDDKVSPPRPRLSHMAEEEERAGQNALMPVRARPTVN